MVPAFCDMNSQSACVTPCGLSMKMRRTRLLPPPRSWTSTISTPSPAPTRSAISRTFSTTAVLSAIRPAVLQMATNKKVGFRPLQSFALNLSIHGSTRGDNAPASVRPRGGPSRSGTGALPIFRLRSARGVWVGLPQCVSPRHALNCGLIRGSGRFRPEPRQREPGPARYRLSTHVTLDIRLRDDSTARITSCHGPLGTIRGTMSMERVYRYHNGTIVFWVACFARALMEAGAVSLSDPSQVADRERDTRMRQSASGPAAGPDPPVRPHKRAFVRLAVTLVGRI